MMREREPARRGKEVAAMVEWDFVALQ